jgi:radical SAM superfamily enzyme YgiQ (UPF0313 family)
MSIEIAWFCGTRVDYVTRDLIENMARAGCVKINFGIESGDSEILKNIRKSFSLQRVQEAVRWAAGAGIYAECSFMLPHPDDTEESVMRTLKFAEKLIDIGAGITSFNLVTPFPGTPLFEEPEKYGIRFITSSYDEFCFKIPVFETKLLPVDKIRELYILAKELQWKTARPPWDSRVIYKSLAHTGHDAAYTN